MTGLCFFFPRPAQRGEGCEGLARSAYPKLGEGFIQAELE
jgi:hypothetical protein